MSHPTAMCPDIFGGHLKPSHLFLRRYHLIKDFDRCLLNLSGCAPNC
jgi:hypothetical protein